jgi:DNA polymerase V
MTPSILPEDLTPNGVQQLKLFDDGQPRANSAQLMKVLNSINPGCGPVDCPSECG